MLEIASQLRDLSARSYVGTEAYLRFGELRTRFDYWWQDIGGDVGMPAGLIDFLKRANSTGATLDQLTGPIREWLTQHDLHKQLRIRLR